MTDTRTIGGSVRDPGLNPVEDAEISLEINAPVMRATDEASISKVIEVRTAADGSWSAVVSCNDFLTPRDSVYKIHEKYPQGDYKLYYVTVPSTLPGGINQVLDLLVHTVPELGEEMAVIADGVNGSILATVLSLTNSKPLTVAIVDGTGTQISSFGGGTQYTEDAVAAADPVGTAVNLVRKDTPSATVSTDGDNITQRGTNFGAAYISPIDNNGVHMGQLEDAVALADPSGIVPILVRKDTPAATVSADGDNIAQRGTNFGSAYSTLLDSAGVLLASAADDAPLAGNPLRIGVRASTAIPTAMSADNDTITPWADRSGAIVVIPQPRSARIKATPTIATSGYVAGDRIGTVMTFTAAALATARSTQIVQASITCRTATAKNDLNLWLFETNPTIASADNAALDITGANLESANPIGVIQFLASDYYDTASSCMCNASLNKGPVTLFGNPTAGADIFGVLEAGATVAAQYAGTTDLIVTLWTNPC